MLQTERVGISLGGSTFASRVYPDLLFLHEFSGVIKHHPEKSFFIVTGGGFWARFIQDVLKKLGVTDSNILDRAAIPFTHINAAMLRAILFLHHVPGENVKVFGGTVPGQSTDGALIDKAKLFSVQRLINVTNVPSIYAHTAEGKPDTDRPIPDMTWNAFFKIFGETHVPGEHNPLGVAGAIKAAESGLSVMNIGKNLDNFDAILYGKPGTGTRIHP